MRLEVADRCYLRILEESDAEELYELVDANRDHLAEWMPWEAGQTLEQTANVILAAVRRHEERNGFERGLIID